MTTSIKNRTTHDPARIIHYPAWTTQAPARAIHDPAWTTHDPAWITHDPAWTTHDPAWIIHSGGLERYLEVLRKKKEKSGKEFFSSPYMEV